MAFAAPHLRQQDASKWRCPIRDRPNTGATNAPPSGRPSEDAPHRYGSEGSGILEMGAATWMTGSEGSTGSSNLSRPATRTQPPDSSFTPGLRATWTGQAVAAG